MANNHEAEEANAIEKINDNLSSATEKIANNKKVIYWTIGGILVIAAFIVSYLYIYLNPRLNRSFEAYNQVEILAQGNDSTAAAEYAKVADKFGGNEAGQLAALNAAEHYYTLGKYKEALNYLDKFRTLEPILAANALVLKGDCQVNLKQYGQAIDSYKKAVKKAKGNGQIVPRVLLKEANVYDAQKKYDLALECYQTIKKDYPDFTPGNGSIDAYIGREQGRLGK